MTPTKIEVVCYANYCRSPVFASMLNQIEPKKVVATSSGLYPMNKSHMDPRSAEYLNLNKINFSSHIPRKFTREVGYMSEIIIACDYEIFTNLKQKYNSISQKVKMISKYSSANKFLKDPFTLKNKKEYFKVLDDFKIFLSDWKDNLG